MALFYLSIPVRVGEVSYLPGRLFDDRLQPREVADVLDAGGLLFDGSDGQVVKIARVAERARLRGASEAELTAIMSSAQSGGGSSGVRVYSRDTFIGTFGKLNFRKGMVAASDADPTQADIDIQVDDSVEQVDHFSATEGQTSFVLTRVPLATDLVIFVVNAGTYVNGVDFTVAGSTLTWTNASFVLALGMPCEARYHY